MKWLLSIWRKRQRAIDIATACNAFAMHAFQDAVWRSLRLTKSFR
jgi:hypothetical protein